MGFGCLASLVVVRSLERGNDCDKVVLACLRGDVLIFEWLLTNFFALPFESAVINYWVNGLCES